jgi:hypothetical protein
MRLEWVQGQLVGMVAAHQTAGLNGALFQQGPIFTGSVLAIGGIQIQVLIKELDAKQDGAEKKGNTAYLLFAMVLLAGGFLFFMQTRSEPKVSLFEGEAAPALWDAAAPTCPQQGPVAAAIAKDRLLLGLAKRTRRPFVVQDGVLAVSAFRTASACYRAAGATEEGKRAESIAKTLQDDINIDYRKRQAGLEYHVDLKDFEAALRDARALLAMSEGQQGPWRTRLIEIERKIQLKTGRGDK